MHTEKCNLRFHSAIWNFTQRDLWFGNLHSTIWDLGICAVQSIIFHGAIWAEVAEHR